MNSFKDEISKDIKQMEDEMEKVFRHLSTFRNYFFPSPLNKPWHPYTDVYETKDDLVIKIELAGIKKENIKIFLGENRIIIRGERQETLQKNKISYRQMEINYGVFESVIPIAIPIDKKKPFKTAVKDGILEVRMKKAKGKRKIKPVK